jgi:hypothetical protein
LRKFRQTNQGATWQEKTNSWLLWGGLKERLKFEYLLAYGSARFVNLPADRIGSEIEDDQRRICELLDLDRSTLWQVCEKKPGSMLLDTFSTPSGNSATC